MSPAASAEPAKPATSLSLLSVSSLLTGQTSSPAAPSSSAPAEAGAGTATADDPAHTATNAATGSAAAPTSAQPGSAGGFLAQLGERLTTATGAANTSAALLGMKSRTATSLFLASNSHQAAAVEEPAYALSADSYEMGTVIGFGSSAVVYIANYKPLSRPVAIKTIDLDRFERNQIDELRKELQVMSLCKHANLLSVKGSFVVGSKLYIVTPYLSAGSCLDIMKTAFPDGFEESVIVAILKQALLGLDYLHKNGLIHRDIKAGNLLMDTDGVVKLADFGVSSSLYDSWGDRNALRRTFVGTPCWIAPEVVQQVGHDYRADIWSLGITALELASGRAPHSKFPPMKVLMLTLQNAPPTLDRAHANRKFTKAFKEMIDSCLQKDPAGRPSADKLVQHACFKHAKKPAFLAETIVRKIPPVNERPHREPRKEAVAGVRASEQSWDFSDDDVTAATGLPDVLVQSLDSLDILSDKSSSSVTSPVSASDDNLAESFAKALAATTKTVESVPTSPTFSSHSVATDASGPPTSQQKKGRFFLGLQLGTPTAPPAVADPLSSSAGGVPTSAVANGAHSRSNSISSAAGEQPKHLPEGSVSPLPPAASAEVKKGRFSVVDGTQPPTIDEEDDGGSSSSTASSRKKHVKILETVVQIPPAIETKSRPGTDSAPPRTQSAPSSVAESLRRGRFEVTSTPHPVTMSPDVGDGDGEHTAQSGPVPLTRPPTLATRNISMPSTLTSIAFHQHQHYTPSVGAGGNNSNNNIVEQLTLLLAQTDQQRKFVADLILRAAASSSPSRDSTLSRPSSAMDRTSPAPTVTSTEATALDTLLREMQALREENEALKVQNATLRAELQKPR